MSNEPNKSIPAQELTEKELEGVVGGKVKVAVKPVTQDVLPAVGTLVKLAETFS